MTDPMPTLIVELAILAGIDFMYVTMEHGTHSDEQVAQMCATARQLDWVVMIRPCVGDSYSNGSAAATLRKCMDMGCSGLVLPNVETLEDLDAIRDAIWLPPRGTRRPGGAGNYWVSDFQSETWRSQVEDAFIVIPMIESRLGLTNCEEIAAHEIVTYLDIGPYDLCLSLGLDYYAQGDQAAELDNAVLRIRAAAESAGKTLLGAHGAAPGLIEQGYSMVMLGEPTALLKAALAEMNSLVKGKRGQHRL
eukprot:SAG31_NODE_5763_length_2338_cov_2.584636_1_plen_249_part_00